MFPFGSPPSLSLSLSPLPPLTRMCLTSTGVELVHGQAPSGSKVRLSDRPQTPPPMSRVYLWFHFLKRRLKKGNLSTNTKRLSLMFTSCCSGVSTRTALQHLGPWGTRAQISSNPGTKELFDHLGQTKDPSAMEEVFKIFPSPIHNVPNSSQPRPHHSDPLVHGQKQETEEECLPPGHHDTEISAPHITPILICIIHSHKILTPSYIRSHNSLSYSCHVAMFLFFILCVLYLLLHYFHVIFTLRMLFFYYKDCFRFTLFCL